MKQDGHQVRIETIPIPVEDPDDDPLLLYNVQCLEGISKPYSIDVSMWAPLDVDIENNKFVMINTAAKVFVKQADQTYVKRKGVFESFQRLERYNRVIGRNFKSYGGRIVPIFKRMDQEAIFRVFERVTVLDVIIQCFQQFKIANHDLSNYVVNQSLRGVGFPTMEYCVQFGESTYNFLSRLMSTFGIYYWFYHEDEDSLEKMVLGYYPPPVQGGGFPQAAPFENDIGSDPDKSTLASFVRLFQQPLLHARVGNFNEVVPTRPVDSGDVTTPVAGGNLPTVNAQSFVQEEFPRPFMLKNEQAKDQAEILIEVNEGQASTITAQSKNPSFSAAAVFGIAGDIDEPGDLGRIFLITELSFNSYDKSYLRLLNIDPDLYQLFVDDLIAQPLSNLAQSLLGKKTPDLAASMAAAGLTEFTQNKLEYEWQPTGTTAKDTNQNPNFATYFTAGALGYLAGMVPSTTSLMHDVVNVLVDVVEFLVDMVAVLADIFAAILLLIPFVGIHLFQTVRAKIRELDTSIKRTLEEKLKFDPDNYLGYANKFKAMPLNEAAAEKLDLPLPVATKTRAWGPHLATVIGPKGVDTAQGDLYADALGRIRVRFPWDHGTQAQSAGASASGNGGDQDEPQFRSSAPTCWLRVSQAWAGQQFGAQFLPRIGDEVIVEFLDGDPDKPIVTGRVYNARSTTVANLPFPAQSTANVQIGTPEDLLNLNTTATPNFMRSGIRTRSMPSHDAAGKLRTPDRYHLLRFDDSRDKEQYLIRSQRRLDITALDKRYESIGSDRHLTVGGKKTNPPGIDGDYIAKVFRHYYLHVGDPEFPTQSGNRVTLVEQNDEIAVKKDANQSIGGNWSTSVGGQATIDASSLGGTIVLNATTNISLTVGSSSVVITPSAIAITAPMVLINSSGPSPASPIDPHVDQPQPPTAADPGDSLNPPE